MDTWITDGIVDAIEHKNAPLYIDWIKTKIMKMIQDVKLCMKNSANIAIVSKKLLKTKNRDT